jgi:hypothetical protein
MAGMRKPAGVHGAVTTPMASVGESALAVASHDGQWWVRTDVPWESAHVASTSHHPFLDKALDQSIVGALLCGTGVGWPHAFERKVLGEVYGDLLSADGRPMAEVLPHGGKVVRWPNGPTVVRF